MGQASERRGVGQVPSPADPALVATVLLQNGVHYHFTTHEAMEADIVAGKFLEHAHVHKNIYGTSIQAVHDVATAGRCCVLDIDVQGARQVGAWLGQWKRPAQQARAACVAGGVTDTLSAAGCLVAQLCGSNHSASVQSPMHASL